MIDVAIVGCGPAGLSAAINIYARNKKAVVLGKSYKTSAIWKAEMINNHLGMPNMTGSDISQAFMDHARQLNIDIREGRVLQIMPMGDFFMLNFENEFIESKKVILAMGVEKGKKITGEEEYLGRGVSYCATCDGMLYRGKDVIVIAECEEAVQDANFLSEICKTVYFVNAGKKTLAEPLNNNITVLNGKVSAVLGDEYVNGIKIWDTSINVDGAFFIKAALPLSSIIYGLETNNNGSVKVNRNMETNIPGIFACGDITGSPYQLSKAIGEGQIAGQRAARTE